MKKILIYGILLVVIASLLYGYYFYRYKVPEMAAGMILKGEYPAMVPERLQVKIEKFRNTANHNVEEIVLAADTVGISVDQLMEGIDQISKEEVMKTYRNILANNITNPEIVFDTAYKYIQIEAFDPVIFKDIYLKNVKKKHLIRAMAYFEKNNLMKNLEMATARKIVKELIIQKKKELQGKTGLIDFGDDPGQND